MRTEGRPLRILIRDSLAKRVLLPLVDYVGQIFLQLGQKPNKVLHLARVLALGRLRPALRLRKLRLRGSLLAGLLILLLLLQKSLHLSDGLIRFRRLGRLLLLQLISEHIEQIQIHVVALRRSLLLASLVARLGLAGVRGCRVCLLVCLVEVSKAKVCWQVVLRDELRALTRGRASCLRREVLTIKVLIASTLRILLLGITTVETRLLRKLV